MVGTCALNQTACQNKNIIIPIAFKQDTKFQNIMFKMPKTQSKIVWHRENKENLKVMWENPTNRNKHQDNTDIRALGKLSDKDFKQVLKCSNK